LGEGPRPGAALKARKSLWPSNQGASEGDTGTSTIDFERDRRVRSLKWPVISVLGLLFQEKDKSKSSVFAPELSASEEVSSTIIDVTPEDKECRCILSSVESGGDDQSASRLKLVVCLLSVVIAWVVYVIAEAVESSGNEISLDILGL
jgi:hypothetical protein